MKKLYTTHEGINLFEPVQTTNLPSAMAVATKRAKEFGSTAGTIKVLGSENGIVQTLATKRQNEGWVIEQI